MRTHDWLPWLLLFLPTFTQAEDIVLPTRSVIDLERGAIRISAPDAAASQTVGVWIRESLETLKTLWGQPMPVQKGVPLEIVFQDDLEGVRFWETWSAGVLRQRIGIPNDPSRQDPLALADALTRAVSHRHLLAATSGTPVNAPAWWIRGHSLFVLNGGAESAMAAWFRQTDRILPAPEVLLPRLEKADPTLTGRAEAMLFCRWARAQQAESVWTWLSRVQERDPTESVRILSDSRDLREVHIRWELWQEADREALLQDIPSAPVVLEQLDRHLLLHPAAFGVSGLSRRYQPLDLEQLAGEIDIEGLDVLLTRWTLRLQPLAFRQSEAVHEVVKGYLEAGSALQNAARAGSRRRESELQTFRETLARARKAHHAVLLGKESD